MRNLLILAALLLSISSKADADVVTFETTFEISDAIEGQATSLVATDNLEIDTNILRTAEFSLPRFDPALGQLNSVRLALAPESSSVNIPINFSDATSGPTTAVLDVVSLRRGIVFAVETGPIRPTPFTSQIQDLDLNDLNSNGFLTGLPPAQQISIPTGASGFPAAEFVDDPSLLLDPDVPLDRELDFFVGTEDLLVRSRTINELRISLDQNGQNVDVIGGTIEYSGRISVTYSFTAVPEPSSTVLLLVPAMFLASRRNRVNRR